MTSLKDVERKVTLFHAKEIKDIAVHPQNPNILVAATDKKVYLSKPLTK